MSSSFCIAKPRGMWLTPLLVTTLWALAGCNQSDAQAQEDSITPKSSSQQAEGVQPAQAKQEEELSGEPSYAEAAFEAKLLPPETIVLNQPVIFRVTLAAQGGYKVNQEYPIKFAVRASPGVSPVKETVRKEDGKVEKMTAELPFAVTLTKAGKLQVGGKLSFSVCTDERCLIEKRDLLVSVDAK